MKKQDISFWNSQESIAMNTASATLFESEKILLMRVIEDLKKPVSQIKILDVGCGAGRTTIPLANMGFDVKGIDIAENLIKILKKKLPNFQIVQGSVTSLPWKDQSFDIVIFSHNSIDYLIPYTQRIRAYHEIRRVLKKNGYFIFSSHKFRFIPYNLNILLIIISNLSRFSFIKGKGYYKEKMNKKTVETFFASEGEIFKELKKTHFSLLDSTTIHLREKNIVLTFMKAILSWERYYLARKKD